MISESEELKCTHNISENILIQNGTITFCKIENRSHYFILIEDKDKNIQMAFSYVPDSTKRYVDLFYKDKDKDLKIYSKDDNMPSNLLYGYLPFYFTKSHVIDTWKLTDKFVRLKTKTINNWSFNRYDYYSVYNILSFIPIFCFTDCIGYSLYHYYKAT